MGTLSKIEQGFLDYLDGPSTWPVWARRAYVLTLPLSAPLFVLGFAVAQVGMLVCALGWVLFYAAPKDCIDWLRGMWRHP